MVTQGLMRGLQIYLRVISAGIGLLLLVGLCLGYRFTTQGSLAMDLSDQAFDAGSFEEAIFQAELAGLLYFPGAGHFKRAEMRLVSIARGAEAEGSSRLALQAWRALALLDSQTQYWGRGSTQFGALASSSIRRLESQPTQAESGAALWKKKATREDHSDLKGPQVPP